MPIAKPFKMRFPVLTMPVSHGGKRAIVVISFGDPAKPDVIFATCVDEDGRVWQGVPFVKSTVMEASRKPACLVEVEDDNSPIAKPILTAL